MSSQALGYSVIMHTAGQKSQTGYRTPRRESYSFVYRTRLEGLSQQLQYHEKSHTQISGAWECIETNYLYPTQPTNQPASQPTSQPTHPTPASQPVHRGRGVFLSRTLPKNRGVPTGLRHRSKHTCFTVVF